MRAVVTTPGKPDADRLKDIDEPAPGQDEVLVEVIAVGVDGTDTQIAAGHYGQAPEGEDFLVMGHESLGRVLTGGGQLAAGTLVAAIVRRPDPVPCPNCAAGEWDYCLNGRYTERGIKARHGLLADRYTEHPDYLIPIPAQLGPAGVLTEPTSIGEKAIEVAWRIGSRTVWQPGRALVTGAGPIGLLAAALLRLRGLEVFVYDRARSDAKIDLTRRLGATYLIAGEHPFGPRLAESIGPVDVAIEATGYPPLAFQLPDVLARNGVGVLTGISGSEPKADLQLGHLNDALVLDNKTLVGSVNANRRHFTAAVADLARLEHTYSGWLEALVTRRVPLEDYRSAFEHRPGDVKTVIDVTQGRSRHA